METLKQKENRLKRMDNMRKRIRERKKQLSTGRRLTAAMAISATINIGIWQKIADFIAPYEINPKSETTELTVGMSNGEMEANIRHMLMHEPEAIETFDYGEFFINFEYNEGRIDAETAHEAMVRIEQERVRISQFTYDPLRVVHEVAQMHGRYHRQANDLAGLVVDYRSQEGDDLIGNCVSRVKIDLAMLRQVLPENEVTIQRLVGSTQYDEGHIRILVNIDGTWYHTESGNPQPVNIDEPGVVLYEPQSFLEQFAGISSTRPAHIAENTNGAPVNPQREISQEERTERIEANQERQQESEIDRMREDLLNFSDTLERTEVQAAPQMPDDFIEQDREAFERQQEVQNQYTPPPDYDSPEEPEQTITTYTPSDEYINPQTLEPTDQNQYDEFTVLAVYPEEEPTFREEFQPVLERLQDPNRYPNLDLSMVEGLGAMNEEDLFEFLEDEQVQELLRANENPVSINLTKAIQVEDTSRLVEALEGIQISNLRLDVNGSSIYELSRLTILNHLTIEEPPAGIDVGWLMTTINQRAFMVLNGRASGERTELRIDYEPRRAGNILPVIGDDGILRNMTIDERIALMEDSFNTIVNRMNAIPDAIEIPHQETVDLIDLGISEETYFNVLSRINTERRDEIRSINVDARITRDINRILQLLPNLESINFTGQDLESITDNAPNNFTIFGPIEDRLVMARQSSSLASRIREILIQGEELPWTFYHSYLTTDYRYYTGHEEDIGSHLLTESIDNLPTEPPYEKSDSEEMNPADLEEIPETQQFNETP